MQVEKRRRYAEWRDDEKEYRDPQGDAPVTITLSPDFFQIPESPPLRFPPAEPRLLPRWRASRRARRDWQGKLQSRIDQEEGVIAALREVVSDTEEDVLPMLRDALVKASGAPGTPLEAKAKDLTNYL